MRWRSRTTISVRENGVSARLLLTGGTIPSRASMSSMGMRRIFIEIRSPDSKLLPVFIDPFPQAFSGNPSLRPRRAFDAHGIGKPVAVAAAEAAAMV
jgi:hypothetical protein